MALRTIDLTDKAGIAMASNHTHESQLEARKWQKPLSIALAILGIIGLLAAGIGLASLGYHQGWWSSAGGLGGVILLMIGMVQLVKACCQDSKESKADSMSGQQVNNSALPEDSSTDLLPHTFKIIPPSEGEFLYRVHYRTPTNVPLEETYSADELDSKVEGLWRQGYTTDVSELQSSEATIVDRTQLEELLVPQSYLFALQYNGNYTTFLRPNDAETIEVVQNVPKLDLRDSIRLWRPQDCDCVRNPTTTLISAGEIRPLLDHMQYTCVIQFDGRYTFFRLSKDFFALHLPPLVTYTPTSNFAYAALERVMKECQDLGWHFIGNVDIEKDFEKEDPGT